MWRSTETKTPTTTLSLSCEYGDYTVSVPREDMPIQEVVEDLFKPVLLAAGYRRESIDKYFEGRADEGFNGGAG
jgi:hypothetical protein